MPEEQCRRYLYESVGLQPWLGSDTDAGPSRTAGDHFFQLTEKGLTRELGYVGGYGEVLDWVTQIYDATRPAPGQPGDPKIRDQLAKIARARAAFRYPAVDADGNRAMRMETPVGWRDAHYPGDVTYAQRPTWDGSPVDAAAATLDPYLVGYVQQMLADNQFFASVREHMKDRGFRVTAGLLEVPDGYATVKAQPPSPHRLPMSRGGGDYVFSDEEDGVLAVKRGDEILYVSLYWRARYGVNHLARVHSISPTFERDRHGPPGGRVRAERPDLHPPRLDQLRLRQRRHPLPGRVPFRPRGRKAARSPRSPKASRSRRARKTSTQAARRSTRSATATT